MMEQKNCKGQNRKGAETKRELKESVDDETSEQSKKGSKKRKRHVD